MNTAFSIISLVAAAAALLISYFANRNAKRSADAAERQAIAAEAAVPPKPPAVDWRLEHRNNLLYVLRNTGTEAATGVRLHWPAEYEDLVRPELGSGTIAAGASARVIIIDQAELPTLVEIGVSWDGHPTPIQVPIPAA